MVQYFLRRILLSIVVVLGVTMLTFFALHLAGDPTLLYVSQHASKEEIEATRAKLGFDRPLIEQYFRFLGGMLRGDLGNSLVARSPALPLVLDRLPATLELTIFSMLLATIVSIPIGIFAATHRGTTADGGVMLFAIIGQSIPSFWLGIMLILFVGLSLRLLPISGQVPIIKPMLEGNFSQALQNFPDAFLHLIMPGITVSVFSISRNARLIRTALLDVLHQDYITTARAKGLAERTITMRHAFRNALIPVVTILGLEFGFLLGGVVITETVFSWPGVGRLVFNSINQRDIPVVQSAVMLLAFLFVALNLVVDVLYAYLDPRIRLD
jgi:peptide/nickel transport system permease protein